MTKDFDISKLNKNKEYIVDVMECAVERPKVQEIQREYYSGKKKKHTIKIQIIIESNTKKKIAYVAFDKGSVHDFTLFKDSTKNIDKEIHMLADSGYQGLDMVLFKCLTPKKKSKLHPLTDQDKDFESFDFQYKNSNRTC